MTFDLDHHRIWLWLAAALYGAAFVSATIALFRGRRSSRIGVLPLVAAGLLLQTVGLHLRGLDAGGCPVRNTFEIVQFVVWSFTVLYLIVGPAFRLSLLGYFTSGLAATMSASSLFVGRWDGLISRPAFGGDPWIEVHATLALFAYGAFGTLALTSIMYLLQNFSLKRKQFSGVFSFLPPIIALENISFRLLLTGLLVLSFSIGVGAVYYHRTPESIGAAKLLIASGVWLAYFVVLILRMRRLLVSNGLAWSCAALFLLVLFSLGSVTHGAQPVAAAAVTALTEFPESPDR